MKKCVIVINGQGRSGKDTICRIMAKRYKVKNVSAIDPVKNIAGYMGWQGEKTDAARKMLADLKQVMIEYGDIPFKYIMERVSEFEKSDEQLMFIHVREAEEIDKIVKNCPLTVKTLLVKRNDSFTTIKRSAITPTTTLKTIITTLFTVATTKTWNSLKKVSICFSTKTFCRN